MKKCVTLCCVLLTLAFAVRAQEDGRRPVRDAALGTGQVPLKHDGKIETNYDGFRHETVVALGRMIVTCEAVRGLQSTLKGVCVSLDRKSTRLNSSHGYISYAVFCLKKKKKST